MSIHFTCPPCKKKLCVADKFAGKHIRCPACGKKCSVPETQQSDKEVEDPGTDEEPTDEELAEEELKRIRKKNKRKRAARRRGLAWVSRGLGFHYAAMLVLMASLAVFFLNLASEMVAMVAPLSGPVVVQEEKVWDGNRWVVSNVRVQSQPTEAIEAYAAINGICYILAAVGFAIVVLLDLPSTLLSLQVPNKKCRTLLVLALLLRGLVIATAIWFMMASEKRLPVLATGGLMVGAWIVWMCYLRQLAVHMDEDSIARQTVRVHIMAFVNAAVTFLFLMVTFYFGMRMIFAQSISHRGALLAGYVILCGALLGIGYKLSGEDSVLKVALYPTGISFLFQYLEIIGSLRLTLLRGKGDAALL